MTETVTETEPTIYARQALVGEPDNIADALERIVRVGALKSWLDDVEDGVRDWLTGRAAETRERTGAAANWPVSGWGRVLETDPDPRPRVTDPDTFGPWWENRYGPSEEVVQVRRVVVRDEDAASRLVELAADVDVDMGDEFVASSSLASLVLDALDYDDSWAIGSDVLDDAVSTGRFLIVGDRGDERLVAVDEDTGEADEVPGTAVSRAPRRLQVRPDKDAAGRVREDLDDLIGPARLDSEENQ